MRRNNKQANYNLDPHSLLGKKNIPSRTPVRQEPKRRSELGEMLFVTKDSRRISMNNQFKGQPLFLILSGPSLNNLDLNEITRVGALSFGVNNSWSIFKPTPGGRTPTYSSFVLSLTRVGNSEPKKGTTFLRAKRLPKTAQTYCSILETFTLILACSSNKARSIGEEIPRREMLLGLRGLGL